MAIAPAAILPHAAGPARADSSVTPVVRRPKYLDIKVLTA